MIRLRSSGALKKGRRRTYAMTVLTFGYRRIVPSLGAVFVSAVQPWKALKTEECAMPGKRV
jgi:hypothetical protein